MPQLSFTIPPDLYQGWLDGKVTPTKISDTIGQFTTEVKKNLADEFNKPLKWIKGIVKQWDKVFGSMPPVETE